MEKSKFPETSKKFSKTSKNGSLEKQVSFLGFFCPRREDPRLVILLKSGVPRGPKWSQGVPRGPKWSQGVPSGPKWSQVVPSGPKWSQVVPSGPKWCQGVPRGPKGSQTSQQTKPPQDKGPNGSQNKPADQTTSR